MLYDYTSHPDALPFTQTVTKNFTPELQWSPDFLICVVLRGSLRLHYHNHTRRFSTNDIYFFLPFEMFSVVQSDADTLVLTISVDTYFVNHLCPDINNITMQKSHVSANLNNAMHVQLCHSLATIIFNTLKNETSSRLRLLSGIADILTTLLEAYAIKTEDSVSHEYVTERNIAILQYINENYMHKISVHDIASHLNIHPQYFSTFFTKQFHTSFIDYLTSFRINRSLERLVHSDDSILTIAMDYGFSNHKTYAAAFHKFYQMSPTQYRKINRTPNPDFDITKDNSQFNSDYGIFSYYRQFLDTDRNSQVSLRSMQKQQTITFDTEELTRNSYVSNHDCFLTVGRAYACLRTEVQQQIIQATKDCPFTHVRFRDIFSDDLYIYYEDADKEPIINWQSLDSVFDFLISLGLKPFPEIGYMPEKLASKKQYSGWQYHPNVSFPKSLEKWAYLLRSFLVHYIDRYGITEVREWYFDFWTCPDLKMKTAYWNESMEDFFLFYKTSYDVFKEVSPDLRLGSPNFSTLQGEPWYIGFFEYCIANNIQPAFISSHIYGCEQLDNSTVLDGFNNIDSSLFSVANPNTVSEELEKLHTIMANFGFEHLDVIISDWNLSFMPKDLVRDTCYMGPFIAHTYIRTLDHSRALCYWSLSDIHEDFFPENTLFRGGPGMMDYHGLKKASYNTFVLLGKLGHRILQKGENYLLVKKDNTYQLLLYNLTPFDYLYSRIDKSALDATHRYNIFENTEDLLFNIVLELPKGTYYIKKYEVNRTYGSAYDIWGQMGFPATLSKDMEDYIRESSVPHISYAWQDVDATLMIDETVPSHGVLLIEISPK